MRKLLYSRSDQVSLENLIWCNSAAAVRDINGLRQSVKGVHHCSPLSETYVSNCAQLVVVEQYYAFLTKLPRVSWVHWGIGVQNSVSETTEDISRSTVDIWFLFSSDCSFHAHVTILTLFFLQAALSQEEHVFHKFIYSPSNSCIQICCTARIIIGLSRPNITNLR